MHDILKNINSPQDIKKLSISELEQLAAELRDFLISVVCDTGGHLAPSLGATELTLALHYIYDTPDDKLIWDVGHQAYIHKIITGRRDKFHTLRQYKGISGFPKRSESQYDHFGVGHASTSISAALGFAKARDLKGDTNAVVAIIGDGSMTGGMAFEGLNNSGNLNSDFTVILNDNNMSISRNVGALSRYLTTLITAPSYNRLKDGMWKVTGQMKQVGQYLRKGIRRIDKSLKSVVVPGLWFERLGFRYIGPINGHNLEELTYVLKQVKKMHGPVLVHVITQKGKGYRFAEENATKFHGLGSFDKDTGLVSKTSTQPSYSKVFGKTLTQLAQKDPNIVTVSAAMCTGCGLDEFADTFPKRFFDVGIAEEHAVTFGAGLAAEGLKPVVTIYSTFLQRGYDQLIHDVALQKLPVIFALDRAGLVGDDGPTHHGNFDLTYLRSIPDMVVMSPKDEAEFQDMLYTATNYNDGPIAVRYPRGTGPGLPLKSDFEALPIGKAEIVHEAEGSDVAILAEGRMVQPAMEAATILEQQGVAVTVVNMRFIKPLDKELLRDVAKRFSAIVTIENNSVVGGLGSGVLETLAEFGGPVVPTRVLGIPDEFIEHGTQPQLYQQLQLDANGIAASVSEFYAQLSGKPAKTISK